MNILDDPTEIDIQDKQNSCTFIIENIRQVYENADQWTSVSGIVYDISPQEIHEYIMGFRYNQNLPIKKIRVNSVDINDYKILAELYDYTQESPEGYLPKYNQKVYFVEGGSSAVVIIPIESKKDTMIVHLELLDRSPKFIREVWEKKISKKNLNDIQLIKASDLRSNH